MTKTTAIVFFSIIAVGLIISYFTLDRFAKPVEVGDEPTPVTVEPEEPSTETPEESGEPDESVEPKVEMPGEAKPPGTAEEPEVAEVGYPSPDAAMNALAGAIRSKDFDAFTDLVGEGAIAPDLEKEVQDLIESPALALSGEKPFSEVSKSAAGVRWALNFEPDEGAVDPPKPRQIYADLEEDEETGFDFKKISFPLL